MKFNKDRLLYKDYNWDMVGTTEAEGNILDRTEGYQVLNFINHFMTDYSLETLKSFQKLERMIHDAPHEIIEDKETLTNWILLNWKKK
jgi:hypothetical protein